MKLRIILKAFGDKLNEQVGYNAKDKPGAARKFKSDILKRIREIPDMLLLTGNQSSLIATIFDFQRIYSRLYSRC